MQPDGKNQHMIGSHRCFEFSALTHEELLTDKEISEILALNVYGFLEVISNQKARSSISRLKS